LAGSRYVDPQDPWRIFISRVVTTQVSLHPLLYSCIRTENRPWANDYCRWSRSHCKGYDYVHYDPKIKLRYFWNDETNVLCGSVHWDNRTEGPPGGAHGASIMFVFDEILAYPIWRTGTPAFTANLNVNLRKMIPFATAARFEARVVRAEGRKRFVEGVITNADGTVKYADATGLWIVSNGIGTSLQVWAEVIEADRRRKERGERILQAPFKPSAALDAPSFPGEELSRRPIPAPVANATLPFQPDAYSSELRKRFDVPVTERQLVDGGELRYHSPEEDKNYRKHNAHVRELAKGPRDYFGQSML